MIQYRPGAILPIAEPASLSAAASKNLRTFALYQKQGKSDAELVKK